MAKLGLGFRALGLGFRVAANPPVVKMHLLLSCERQSMLPRVVNGRGVLIMQHIRDYAELLKGHLCLSYMVPWSLIFAKRMFFGRHLQSLIGLCLLGP